MVDFSKAFDTVDHVIFIRKLQALNMPPHVYNWIISFLTGRVQRCKVQDTLSKIIGINFLLYRALRLDHPYISSWKLTCIPDLEIS